MERKYMRWSERCVQGGRCVFKNALENLYKGAVNLSKKNEQLYLSELYNVFLKMCAGAFVRAI